jgi:hypothetical protein
MNFSDAEKIAAAVLYEGYILYPYRATSTKNVQRWNFGTLYPRDYALAQRPVEAFRFSTECLIEAASETTVDIRVRFLHLVRQQSPDAAQWDVGIERTVEVAGLRLTDVDAWPLLRPVWFPNEEDTDGGGQASAEAITGECRVRMQTLEEGLSKLCLEFSNTTPVPHPAECARSGAMRQSFVSAHVLLGVYGGAFVSLLDPPNTFRSAAAACQNTGVFPVLVGAPGERTTILCSPIILYDYPQVAPESLGDFFDGTEMDEMLALRVLTLTDEEKQEMRQTDERARRILERTEMLPQEHLSRVHGAIRGMRAMSSTACHREESSQEESTTGAWDPFAERPALNSIRVFGVELRAGNRVRLWPQKKADIMDIALEGRAAVIEAIEQDLEDNVQLAVVVDDDPGREFGILRQPGHRFFFAPEEVEPLSNTPSASPPAEETTPSAQRKA